MNRVIKFRGRLKRTKKWMYGDLAHVQGEPVIQIDVSAENRRTIGMNVEPDSVGQFVGLHDKNGREIYEGDILRVVAYNGEYDYTTQVSTDGNYEVDVCGQDYDCTHISYLSPCYDDDCEIEVIGNIYDNPELIKK